MPRTLDTRARTFDVTSAFIALVDSGGLAAPSLRAIARRTGISASTLSHQLSCRERLLHVVGWSVAERFSHDRLGRCTVHGSAGLLPDPAYPETLPLTRAWLAVQELARATATSRAMIRTVDHQELMVLDALAGLAPWPAPWQMLAKVDDLPPLSAEEETTLALLAGLRSRLVGQHAALDPRDARRLLDAHLAATGGGAAPAA